MAEYAELEIGLERQGADCFAVDLRFSLPDSDVERRRTAEEHTLAINELRQLVHDPAAYGRRLGQDVFTFPDVREALAVARSSGLDLRFRLSLAPSDKELHGLRWETLADPDAPPPGAPLLLSERVLFSRYVDSGDWRPVTSRAKGELRALVVVANPSDLAHFRLAPVDVPGEIARARQGMTGITSIDVLGESDRASMQNIVDCLRAGPDILYLVCHGALVDGMSALWLEKDDGTTDRRDGNEVVLWLGELKQPPRLVVLVSCQSAGTSESSTADATVTAREEAWAALGPRLGASGVPAVLAMHGNVTMTTIEAFMPVFFRELQKDGIVDRAVAVARGAVRDRPDAWSPVLYMRLKSGRLWSQPGPTEGVPPPSAEWPSHNLPAQSTALIGREAELATLRQKLAASDARLITLIGPGGIGKTHLAMQAALDSVEVFPDGVWWVPLAAITDPTLVIQAIATPLGVREVAGEPLEETLGQYLRSRQMLLLLDNLEQVLAAAPLIAQLLEAAPGLRVLATSRAPLRVHAEQEVPVTPLSLPPGTSGKVSLTDVQGSPAVQLFLARAQAVKPAFTLDAGNAPTIAAICRQLDGLPLAIELAAARVRILSPDQLLGRLDERLKLLTGGSRDLPERHQTLRATIAWSHELLEPDEQTLFARLAVFSGGCTFEAAEAVCGGVGDLALDVLDGLDSLVQKSLLRQGEGADDEPRFTMLQTIREYGLQQLDAQPDANTVRRAHAEYFLSLVRNAAPHLKGTGQGSWFNRLEQDHDNLRTGIEWALAAGEGETAIGMVETLWRFWNARGYLQEGRRRVEATIRRFDTEGTESQVSPRLLLAAGTLARTLGDYAVASSWFDRGLKLARATGDRDSEAAALLNLGNVALSLGDHRHAVELYQSSLELTRQIGDRWREAHVSLSLGTVAHYLNDIDTAERSYDAALAIWDEAGDKLRTVAALANLTLLLAPLPDRRDRARELGERCLAESRELSYPAGIAAALRGLGIVAQGDGDLVTAAARFKESLAVCCKAEDRSGVATDLGNLALIVTDLGDPARALRLASQSLSEFHNLHDATGVATTIEMLASTFRMAGDANRAACLHGAAAAALECVGIPIPLSLQVRHDASLAALREALGPTFDAEWQAGKAMPLDDVLTSLSLPAASGSTACELGMAECGESITTMVPAD
jgi:predicted ATPase